MVDIFSDNDFGATTNIEIVDECADPSFVLGDVTATSPIYFDQVPQSIAFDVTVPNPLCGGYSTVFTQNAEGTTGTGDLAALIQSGFDDDTDVATISPAEPALTAGDYSITATLTLSGSPATTATKTFTISLDTPCSIANYSFKS